MRLEFGSLEIGESISLDFCGRPITIGRFESKEPNMELVIDGLEIQKLTIRICGR